MPIKTLLKYGKICNLNLVSYTTLVDKLSAICKGKMAPDQYISRSMK